MPLLRKGVAIWSSRDALVIRMLTLVLESQLPVHNLCEHVRGNGGGMQSRQRVHEHLQQGSAGFVFRTDIRGYYAAIDKSLLWQQLSDVVRPPVLRDLLWQFLHYSVENGGQFHTPRRGISRGSALSPLLAAFHLTAVDAHFAGQSRVRYVRYMDDFLILARSRWHLRRAVRELKQFLQQYGFTLHPDKTQLGRVSAGFDWMGLWFTAQGAEGIAPRAVDNHRKQYRRLYEQIRGLSEAAQVTRMALYRSRWLRALIPARLSNDIAGYGAVRVSVRVNTTSSPSSSLESSGLRVSGS